jgi:diguanylate cyclase (GGDEF)-like protein/PAS domain S-box-containing protein
LAKSKNGHSISHSNQIKTPELEIANQNKLLEALFKNSTDAIAYFDKHNRIIDININFQNLFGYTLAEISGKDVDDALELGKINSVNRDYTNQVLSGKKVIAEETRYTKNGSPIDLLIKGIPVFIDGTFCGGYAIYSDISERKKTAEKLKERERQLNTLLDNIPGIVYRCKNDALWTMEFVSNGSLRLTGYQPEELIGNRVIAYNDLIHPGYRKEVWLTWQQYLENKTSLEIEYPIFTASGEEKWVWERGSGVFGDDDEVLFIEGFITDISKRKAAEEALKKSEERHRKILTAIKDGYFEVDLTGNIVFCNEAASRMLGYTEDEFIGINYRTICRDHKYVFNTFNRLFQTGKTEHALTTEMIQKNGTIVYGELTLSVILDQDGTILGFRGIGRDVTERKQYEDQLKYLSLHDQLTGLHNRTFFENELLRLGNSRDYPVTIIVADLDGLKILNDTVGHEQGDQLLISCAEIMKKSLRQADLLARIGGDEFVIILPRTEFKTGKEIAGRIHASINAHNNKQAGYLPLSISTGISTSINKSKSLQDTFIEADDLMYRDKLNKGVVARSQIFKSLIAALGKKDYLSDGHGRRLEQFCMQIGRKVGLSEKKLSDLRLLSQAHDLGKVGIPDRILFKIGRLTDLEWQLMKQHSEKGYRIALSSADLSGAAGFILKHHENWDGTGYPLGIKGEEIPVESRILALADAYDAMTSDRTYREALSKQDALAELQKCSGSQFDPDLTKVFLSILGN